MITQLTLRNFKSIGEQSYQTRHVITRMPPSRIR